MPEISLSMWREAGQGVLKELSDSPPGTYAESHQRALEGSQHMWKLLRNHEPKISSLGFEISVTGGNQSNCSAFSTLHFAPDSASEVLFEMEVQRPPYRDTQRRTACFKMSFSRCFLSSLLWFRSRPGKPKQRKGQNEKFMNFAHFCEFWCFFLSKTSTIHIELLFRNAPVKSS